MSTSSAKRIDRKIQALSGIERVLRPEKGWLRAMREALGMTAAQFGKRLGVTQPTATYLEHAEITGSITFKNLERAAQALGCRVVYLLVPEKPLAETMRERAIAIAKHQVASVEHSMRLEDQEVTDHSLRTETQERLIQELLNHPTRLWDER
jgi:predicted DNA-binding mobile mystery protein A